MIENIRLLVVDDELDFLETLMKRLRKRGVQVKGVRSGEEALEFLEKEAVDVVILDVKMPGMDGLETLRAIKAKHPLVEVIMLTGHANVETAVTGMELGAFDYLMKPMDIDDLLYKVQDAYQKKMLHETRIALRRKIAQSGAGDEEE